MAIMANPVEQRERAVKMVLDHLDEYRSVYAACVLIGLKVRCWCGVAAAVGVAGPGRRRLTPGSHVC
jgi:hypothetical protein